MCRRKAAHWDLLCMPQTTMYTCSQSDTGSEVPQTELPLQTPNGPGLPWAQQAQPVPGAEKTRYRHKACRLICRLHSIEHDRLGRAQDFCFWTGRVNCQHRSIPIGSSPANLGIRAGGPIDLGLAVDGEVALQVKLLQLLLDAACLTVEALHLTPRQHSQVTCRLAMTH